MPSIWNKWVFGNVWTIILYLLLNNICIISFVVVFLQGISLLHVEWKQLWRCKQKQNGKRELKFLSLKVISLIFQFIICPRMTLHYYHPEISFNTHIIQICSLCLWLSQPIVLNRRKAGSYKHCWRKEEFSDLGIRSIYDGSSKQSKRLVTCWYIGSKFQFPLLRQFYSLR